MMMMMMMDYVVVKHAHTQVLGGRGGGDCGDDYGGGEV